MSFTPSEMELIKTTARVTASATVYALGKANRLRPESSVAYDIIKERLYDYYRDRESDPALAEAIDHFSDDPYFGIIEGCFFKRMSTFDLANQFGCDTRTITRKKKDLCLSIWMELREAAKNGKGD